MEYIIVLCCANKNWQLITRFKCFGINRCHKNRSSNALCPPLWGQERLFLFLRWQRIILQLVFWKPTSWSKVNLARNKRTQQLLCMFTSDWLASPLSLAFYHERIPKAVNDEKNTHVKTPWWQRLENDFAHTRLGSQFDHKTSSRIRSIVWLKRECLMV